MSDFGRLVANILGVAWDGIYHIGREVLHERCEWHNRNIIQIVVHGGLATVDHNRLTQLVVLAHVSAVRIEIEGAATNYLRLWFSRRTRGDSLYRGHPGIGEAIGLDIMDSCLPETAL